MPMRDELIQRAIQQLAITFARLISRHGAIGSVEAGVLRSEIEALYPAFLGTSAALLRRLGTEDILGVLRTAGYVDGERAYLLGALFEAEAELLVAEGDGVASDGGGSDPEVTSLRLRALDLVLEAGIEELGEPDIPERVERLRTAVTRATRPAASWERLHRYFAMNGAYARAEDALFAWLDALGSTGSDDRQVTYLTEVGGSFYRSLADVDDATLEAGGLPRDEVGEGRASFEESLSALQAARATD